MKTQESPVPAPDSRLDRQLLKQVEGFVSEAQAVLESADALVSDAGGSLTLAASLLSGISLAALAAIEPLDGHAEMKARELTSMSLRALDLLDSVHHRIALQRTRTDARMRQALDRLRRVSSSAALLDRVCVEVVESCGFQRAMLAKVESGDWLPWLAYFSNDRELERQVVEWMNEQQFPASDLGGTLLALQPVIVRDALKNPGPYAPMLKLAKTPCYVAAPIKPAGRLVGVLYADRYPTGRLVDEIDRDMLWAFAEDFSLIYERTVLLERMRAQRARIAEAFDFAENMMSSLANAEIELARTPAARIPEGDDVGLAVPSPSAAVDELLTAREAEVLTMMVRGASNAMIAEHLMIKHGTVKSHVKHILRKLDAVNRAEAISRYMGR
jgi:DNA-binding CsgD family transcriptional regulator